MTHQISEAQITDILNKAIQLTRRNPQDVQKKSHQDYVTDVDTSIDRMLTETLPQVQDVPVLSEERVADAPAELDAYWMIDPLDGTKSFVRGYPFISTQIALMHRGELVVGVSSAPCWNGGAGELLHAAKGHGAWLGDQCLSISPVERLDRATLSTGNLNALADSPAWARFGELVPKLHRLRGYGDFLHYHWLASGKLDVVMESNVNILDIAANVVIVREAGGRFTSLDGTDGPWGGNALASNGHLHDAALSFLGSLPDDPDSDDPDWPRTGPGSVSDLRARRSRD